MVETPGGRLTITLPFWVRQHPGRAEAQRRTREWARRFGPRHSAYALSRFDALGYGRLMSYACPTSGLAELQLVSDWNTLFFIFNDLQGNAATTSRFPEYDQLRHALWRGSWNVSHGPPTTRSPRRCRTGAIALSPAGHPAWTRRFELHLKMWLTGHARENAYRSAGATPDPHEYTRLRRDDPR